MTLTQTRTQTQTQTQNDVRRPKLRGMSLTLRGFFTVLSLLGFGMASTGCNWIRDSRAPVLLSPANPKVEQGGLIKFVASKAGRPVEGVAWELDKEGMGALSQDGLFHAAYVPGSLNLILKSTKGVVLARQSIQITPAVDMFATTGFAELFDPATGRFEPVGSLAQPRFGHTATLLPDGKVLILGGSNGPREFTDSELFDPLTRTFSSTTANLLIGRRDHTATLLGNGQVLVVGGIPYGDIRSVGDAIEILDLKTNLFTFLGTAEIGRRPCRALPLRDGRLLLAGDGLTIFDPSTHSFTVQEEAKGRGLAGMASVVLDDGRVLFCGGSAMYGGGVMVPLDDAFLFSPSRGIFSTTGGLYRPRLGHILVPSAGGARVLGGQVRVERPPMQMTDPSGQTFHLAQGTNQPADSTETFDPARGIFTTAPGEAPPGVGLGLPLADGGTILWTGGSGSDPDEFAWRQDIQTGKVTQLPRLAVPRSSHTATLLKDGRVLIVGGRTKYR